MPHSYRWHSDGDKDHGPAIFMLQPIDAATLDTHPALPDDWPRLEQLRAILDERLKPNPETAFTASGVFQQNDDGTLRVF